MRFGVAQRGLFDGTETLGLTAAELSRIRRLAATCKAEAFAICLLHSYANPKGEEALARALAPLGRPISVSRRILAEYREYERLSTTVVNAYVSPRMITHLENLERRLGGASLRVMNSGGAAIGTGLARSEPVRTILSGPAAGVIGAADLVRAMKVEQVHHLRHGRDLDRRVAVRSARARPHAQLP